MVWIEHGNSIRRTRWQQFAKICPRVMDADGAKLRITFNAKGFGVMSPRADHNAEIACARAIIDEVSHWNGYDLLTIWSLFGSIGGN